MSNKSFQNLLNAVQKAKAGGATYSDDKANYWKAETDKSGAGYAVIRFLPGKTDDDVPFVKVYNHGFQGDNGKWFIENCPTTIGQECPACAANSVLWNSGRESDKEIVRKRKRRVSYVANILVVQDSKNPENEGKVLMFKFGQKIFDKLVDKLQPQFEDEQPMNPFDPVEGANFKLKIRKVEGYSNYDKSEFDEASEIDGFDKIKEQMFNINELVDPVSYKSFDELKKKLDLVLGGETITNVKSKGAAEDDDDSFIEKATKAPAKKVEPKVVKEESSDDEDSDLEYFRKLSEED